MGAGASGAQQRCRFDEPLDGPLTSPLLEDDERSALFQRSAIALKRDDISPKEFATWVSALRPELIGIYVSGKALAAQIKEALATPAVQEASRRHAVKLAEAAAVLFYSADTAVPSLLGRFLRSNGPLAAFEPLLLPLLRGIHKLPPSGSSVLFKTRSLETKHDIAVGCCSTSSLTEDGGFCNSKLIFHGFTSCSVFGLAPLQRAILLEAHRSRRCELLCIKTSKGHSLGELCLPGCSEGEVVLCPGWTGRVAGKVDDGWKALLGSIWSIDMTWCDVLEVCDEPEELQQTCAVGFAAKEICSICLRKFTANKSDVESASQVAEMYRLAGRPDKQIVQLQHLLSLDPKWYDAHVTLAQLFEKQERPADAARHYSKALNIDPRDPSVHNSLGQLLEKHLHDKPGAKTEYEWALRLSPNNPDAHAYLGKIIEERDKGSECDIEIAKEHYHSALLVNPKHPQGSYLLARLLWRSVMYDGKELRERQIQKIVNLFDVAIAQDKTAADPRYWFARFLADPRIGRYNDACFQLEMALHLDPSHSEAHNQLGQLLASIPGAKLSSRDHLMMAMRLDPNCGSAQTNLAALCDHDTLDPATAKSYYGFMLQAPQTRPS